MSDMMDTLKGLLGDDAEEKIGSVMNMLQNSDSPIENTDNTPAITPELLSQLQGLFSKLSDTGDDNRTSLLMSLKPYMRNSRRETIDSAIKLLNAAKISQLFMGGI